MSESVYTFGKQTAISIPRTRHQACTTRSELGRCKACCFLGQTPWAPTWQHTLQWRGNILVIVVCCARGSKLQIVQAAANDFLLHLEELVEEAAEVADCAAFGAGTAHQTVRSLSTRVRPQATQTIPGEVSLALMLGAGMWSHPSAPQCSAQNGSQYGSHETH